MERLRHLVYCSQESRVLLASDLADILTAARQANTDADITGILLYRGGHFLQVLEGHADPLTVLFNKIAQDKRHSQVRLLLEGPSKARAFGAWSMAFKDITGLPSTSVPGYSTFLDKGFTTAECVRYPHEVLKMVLAFRRTGGL